MTVVRCEIGGSSTNRVSGTQQMRVLVVAEASRADRLIGPLTAGGGQVIAACSRGQARGHLVPPGLRRLRKRIGWLWSVGHSALSDSIDGVFSSEFGPVGLSASMLARLIRRPFVLRMRGDIWREHSDLIRQGKVSDPKARYWRWITNQLVGHAHAIAPVSESIARAIREYTDYPEERIAPIPIAVNTWRYRPPLDKDAVKRSAGYDFSHIILLATQFQYADKIEGLEKALPMLRAVVESYDDTAVVIAGDGALKDAFEQAHQTLLDHPRIIMAGWVDDMARLYQCSDVFCHFSYLEGCPNVLFEAWASGVPVIVNDYAPLLENLEPGATGYVLDNELNPREALPIFERLLYNEHERREMGEHCRQRAKDEFSPAVIGRRLLSLIRPAQTGRTRLRRLISRSR